MRRAQARAGALNRHTQAAHNAPAISDASWETLLGMTGGHHQGELACPVHYTWTYS